MNGRVLYAALALDQIRDAPRGPQAGPIPERLRPPLEPGFDLFPVRIRQLRRTPGPKRPFQRIASALGELLHPPIHRLAMDADTPRDFRFAHALLDQPRRVPPPPFQFHAIEFDAGWLSHAGEYSRFCCNCHYVM